jgi:hypothetical protein
LVPSAAVGLVSGAGVGLVLLVVSVGTEHASSGIEGLADRLMETKS